MNTIDTPINKIQPYNKNAKKHSKKQVEQVANSIKEFGFNQPIVTDKKGIIIVGHGRFEAAKLLGLETVPVLQVTLSPAKAKAYRLADNKLNESDWDMDLVIDELKELDNQGFDISLTGFDEDLLVEEEDNDDDVPEIPAKAISVPGDIYVIGRHRVMCGDSVDIKAVEKLMDGKMADMVFTDPPYNVDYAGRGKKTSNKIMNDKMGDIDFDNFLFKVFDVYSQIVKTGAAYYVFHSSSTQEQFERAMLASNIAVRTQLIWNKPSASMGWGDYRMKHEPFFYAGVKGKDVQFYGDRTHTSVVDIPEDDAKALTWLRKQQEQDRMGHTTIFTLKRESMNLYVHPTQKPVELIMYTMTNSSKQDDIVVDLFGGSGATLIAAEKMGRIANLMELDPKYVDVIVQRWVDFTGETIITKNGKVITWPKTKNKEEKLKKKKAAVALNGA